MKLTKKQRALLHELKIRTTCDRCQRLVVVRYAYHNGLNLCLACIMQELEWVAKTPAEPKIKFIKMAPGCKTEHKPFRLKTKAPWRVGNKQVLRRRA